MKTRHIKAICNRHGAITGDDCPKCSPAHLLDVVEVAGKRWANASFLAGCRKSVKSGGGPVAFEVGMKREADAGARFEEAVERLRAAIKGGNDG